MPTTPLKPQESFLSEAARTDPRTSKESSFDCQVENHLLGRGENVFAIYFHACRIAVKGEYYPSAKSVANHFGIGVNTVRRAWKTLCELGFFEKQPRRSKLSTGIYRVVKEHSEWAAAHPGHCRERKAEQQNGKPAPINPPNFEEKTGSLVDQPPAKPVPSDFRRTPPQPDAVTLLLRALAAVSEDHVSFYRPHWKQLASLLETYRQEEIVAAFARFLDDLNLDDPKDRKFAAQNFLDNADSACHNAREQKIKREQDKAEREAWAKSMQEQAEQERLIRAQQENLINEFDPLAD